MQTLPPIGEHFMKRPGDYPSKTAHFVPDPTHASFWTDFYKRFSKLADIQFPIKRGNKHIDQYFGCFGFRYHPTKLKPKYFHIGIDIPNKPGTLVYPLAPGVFEYSGFTATNGKYVLLSHPEIKTEDGFELWSIYMHLSKYNLKFTRYQKMLREISFHTYPTLPAKLTKSLGRVGATGDVNGMISHLHLQLEFRKKDTIVAIDGLQAFGKNVLMNKSENLKNETDFAHFREANQKELKDWEIIWKKK